MDEEGPDHRICRVRGCVLRAILQCHPKRNCAGWSVWLTFPPIRIFLVFYVNSLQQQITGSLSPYVTSAFNEHPLVATTSILSSIIGAVAKLPIAKIIDIWGRAEGYSLMVFLCTIGEMCFAH